MFYVNAAPPLPLFVDNILARRCPIRGQSSQFGKCPKAATVSGFHAVGYGSPKRNGSMATITEPRARYVLSWDSYSQWAPTDDEIGAIYSDCVHIHAIGNVQFQVTFRVGTGRQLGLLFTDVVCIDNDFYQNKVTYCMGQFHTNKGAKLFAQFSLNHFVETETWLVCPSFEPVDYINGDPYTLAGVEIVSDII